MWMAAGFTMLEAGLVQKKDVSEIVTKEFKVVFNRMCHVFGLWIYSMYHGSALIDGILPGMRLHGGYLPQVY